METATFSRRFPKNNMDLKKAYYYIICLVALFVLFWGAVDLTSATAGLSMSKSSVSLDSMSPTPAPEGEQPLDVYYQKKMLYDRLSDSLARIVIAGLVFFYSRKKADQLEKS